MSKIRITKKGLIVICTVILIIFVIVIASFLKFWNEGENIVVQRFKSAELREALEACVEADENVKTGKMNDVMSVEILICKYSSADKKVITI